MTTPSVHWPAIKAVFEATIDLPAAQREQLIHAAGLEASAVRDLRSLLAHHDQADASPVFMVGSAAQTLAETPAPASRAGQRLGAWEIVRPIGAGGMGEVFEARRADGQYEGRAAVKLLKRGMDSAAVLQRFALERQALARLSHPHIARLLDAGASDDGLPYFVLDYVDGRPIDEAVRGLPLPARLAVFLQLADAVAHAHRNLLVHRDLKPGNVLVDNQGQVKLLDFGIAKALDPLEGSNGPDGHSTVGGERPYTPQHASPEQVRGEPVSTATDIYSLGVLLYQMLTGTRPTGRAAGTRAEAERSVLEDEPTRPSRLSARDALDPNWVQTRRLLEGDLDNILLKTLEKTVERRYSSVEALAADLRAVIDGRPVSARPASPAYVLGKFLHRHRWAVMAGGLGGLGAATGLAAALLQGRVAAALGALGLTAGLAMALLQGRRAELARANAERHVAELRQLSRDVVVEYGDAITYVPGGMERKAAMLTTTLGYMNRLAGAAADDLAFQGELGSLYARLADLRTSGEFNAAEHPADATAHARRAVQLFAAAEPAHALDVEAWCWWSKALGVLAKAAQARGDLQAALQHLQSADAVLQRGLSVFASDQRLRRARADTLMLTVQLRFGFGRPNLNQPDEALAGLDEARLLYAQAAAGPGPAVMQDVFQLGTVASTRALILARLERWSEAIAAAQEAVEQRQRASDMEPHNRVVIGGVAADRNLLGGLCLNVGDHATALAATQLAWHTLDRLQAEDADNQAWLTQRRFLALNHGRALLGSGEVLAAQAPLQLSADWLEPLVAQQTATSAQRRRLAQTWLAQAETACRSGQRGPADRWASQAEATLQALVAEDPADRDHLRVQAECATLRARWPTADGLSAVG